MEENRSHRSRIAVGIGLIALGVLFLLARTLDVFNWGFSWPMIIMIAGASFLVIMVIGGRSASPLAIPGSILLTVGGILLLQNTFGWFESWAYAWTLVISGIGLGIFIQGVWSGDAAKRRRGLEVVQSGLVLFIILGVIFEIIFSYTGVSNRGGRMLWPAALLLLGALLLAFRVVSLFFITEAEKRKRLDLFSPFLFMSIGALVLLANLGWVSPGQLLGLLNFWPLLLVAAGVIILLRNWAPWVGGFAGAGLAAAMFLIVFAGKSVNLAQTPLWVDFANQIQIEGKSMNSQRIEGNGTIKSETKSLSGFKEITLQVSGVLEIAQGDKESILVETDENLLPYLTFQVNGDELLLGWKAGVTLVPSKEILYRITVRDLEAVRVGGMGKVTIGAIKTEELTLVASGAADFTVKELQAEELKARISGSGRVEAAGQTTRLEVRISGAGNFTSPDLRCEDAEVEISGVGNVVVWAEKRLETKIEGAGNIAYYGAPTLVQEKGGIGKVTSLGRK